MKDVVIIKKVKTKKQQYKTIPQYIPQYLLRLVVEQCPTFGQNKRKLVYYLSKYK